MKRLTAVELMTPSPGWCTAHEPVQSAALLMAEHDCGAIPVVDDPQHRRPVGVVTDRDIVLRVVAPGRAVFESQIRDAMTPNPVVVHEGASFAECAQTMRERRVRRLMVVDDRGKVIGIVTDGDLARSCHCDPGMEHEVATLVEEVSRSPDLGPPCSATPVITGHSPVLDGPGPNA